MFFSKTAPQPQKEEEDTTQPKFPLWTLKMYRKVEKNWLGELINVRLTLPRNKQIFHRSL